MQSRPGNSLKQCNELVALGRSEHALELLHNTIINRRFRQQGAESASEELMMRYIDLCVLFPKKDRKLRDALQAYRSATQSQSSSNSLHKILQKLRDGFEWNQQKAKKENAVQVIVDSQRDLEAAESPESLTYAMLGGGDVSDAGHSAVIQLESSLAALWESYRTILEVTKSIPKLEAFYHETATKALLFCEENERPIEFRKLCDLLRNHRARQRPDAETLQKSEFHIETRIVQLKAATSLKLWAEAFASAEDLVSLGLEELVEQELLGNPPKGKVPAVSLVTIFFDQLTELMWVSGNLVCHAFSTFQSAQMKRTIAKSTPDPRLNTYLSSLVVLSALGTPTQGMSFLSTRPSLNLECQKRLGHLMWFSDVPNRTHLMHLIKTKDLLKCTAPCVKKLFALVKRIDEIPEGLCAKAVDILLEVEKLDKEYQDLGLTMNAKRLIPHIKCSIVEQVVFNHIMEQHPTIPLAEFCRMACPPGFLSWNSTEKLIVLMAKRSDHSLRIDYANGTIHFGRRVFEKVSNFLPHLSSSLVTKVHTIRDEIGDVDLNEFETTHCVELATARFKERLSERVAAQEQRDKYLKEAIRQARETVREKKKQQDDLRKKKAPSDEAYSKEMGGDKKSSRIDMDKFMGSYRQIIVEVEESAKKLKKSHPPPIGGRKWNRIKPADFLKSTEGHIELNDVIKFLEDCKTLENEEKAASKAVEFEVRNWEIRSRRDAEMNKIGTFVDTNAGKEIYTNILATIEKERRASLFDEKYFGIVSGEISTNLNNL